MTERPAQLEPLKTIHEVNADDVFVNALVIEIPVKLANKAQSILKPHLSTNEKPPSLHHLRRLVPCKHLPVAFRKDKGIICRKTATIFLILADHGLAHDAITATLKPHIECPHDLPRLFSTPVPAHPPANSVQAKLWSETHWPCTYNPASQTLQEAPPLRLLRTTQAELETESTYAFMRLAGLLAQGSESSGLGRGVGAVVVDPVKNEVVAAAGDARLWSRKKPMPDSSGSSGSSDLSRFSGSAISSDDEIGPGRPEYHALMRAIAMVAQKEIRRRSTEDLSRATLHVDDELLGPSLNEIESSYYDAPEKQHEELLGSVVNPAVQSTHKADSYLCNGLDIYLTHEPCVCCAMAMLHSRFRVCVFLQKMPATGALCADTGSGGLGYALFWRKQLNWRTMTFQYRPETSEAAEHDAPVEMFHA